MTIRTGIALLMLVLALGATAEDPALEDDWRLEKDQDGIQVYTRAVQGVEHRAVKAIMIVEVGPAELVALVRDTAACPEWAQFCKSSHEHEVLSETELYVYTLNEMPWPIKDRDAISHVLWTQDAHTGAVAMHAAAVTGVIDESDDALRLIDAETSWTFIPQADGRTTVISEAHVDPGGPLPSWITNRLLVDAPFDTLAQMRELVSSGRYSGVQFDFIDE